MSHLPRVLFVDDDEAVLAGLNVMMRKQRKRYEIASAVGGRAGIQEATRATFDVVITDMRMPDVDGASVLEAVRDHDPTTFRIVLSGFSDRNATNRAFPLTHQFLDKPCDSKLLVSTLDRACALRAVYGSPAMRALVSRLVQVASPGDATSEPDSAVSARTLRLALSQFLGTESVPRGPETAAARALADFARARLALPIPGFSLAAFKLRSAAMAESVQKATTSPDLFGDAFTAGLVHEVGRVLVAVGLPAEHAEIELAARGSGVPRSVIERRILGVTEAELAAYVLTLQGIPLAVIEAVAFHDSETVLSSPLSVALRAAHARHDHLREGDAPALETAGA